MIIYSATLNTQAKVINIYGGTTWVKIEGRFLLGQSSSYAINSTGGSATHVLTVNEMPAHNHEGKFKIAAGAFLTTLSEMAIGNRGTASYDSTGNTITPPTNGGGQAHNNMPPYKVVYIWQRTS